MSSPLPSLVADIGGTNTRVALSDGRHLRSESIRRFANDDHPDLDNVLRSYLAQQGQSQCDGACIAMAGPVKDGVARLTNRDWSMDKTRLASVTNAARAAILNDLQAQGHALSHLPADGTRQLRTGAPHGPDAAMLVVGIGTGFNIAPVYMTSPLRVVPPAEAGHALLPLRNAQDLRLAAWLARDHGVASVEDLLSGRGIEAAYAWAAEEAGQPSRLSGREVLTATNDPVAARAVQVIARHLGVVLSDLAISLLPFGGIYLAGGVARALAPLIAGDGLGDTSADPSADASRDSFACAFRDSFVCAFRDKGRFSAFMDQFSIHVIEDDCAALIGCAAHLHALSQTGE